MQKLRSLVIIGLLVATVAGCQAVLAPGEPSSNSTTKTEVQKVQVVFFGGHETEEQDRGRPVVLIAAALNVPTQVFRDAFRGVRPAPAGTKPTREQERRNKAVLLAALKPYGVTNERLDEVSNYYRYRREEGELWPTQPAVTYALVKNGKVTGFEVEQGGSGYSSPPTVTVPGFKDVNAEVQLAFNQDFDSNGSVTTIKLVGTK